MKKNTMATATNVIKIAKPAISRDMMIRLFFVMRGKWLYPSYALRNAAIPPRIPRQQPMTSSILSITEFMNVTIHSVYFIFMEMYGYRIPGDRADAYFHQRH